MNRTSNAFVGTPLWIVMYVGAGNEADLGPEYGRSDSRNKHELSNEGLVNRERTSVGPCRESKGLVMLGKEKEKHAETANK